MYFNPTPGQEIDKFGMPRGIRGWKALVLAVGGAPTEKEAETLLFQLPARKQAIVRLRFGLGNRLEDPTTEMATFKTIGATFGVSGSRARGLVEASLRGMMRVFYQTHDR